MDNNNINNIDEKFLNQIALDISDMTDMGFEKKQTTLNINTDIVDNNEFPGSETCLSMDTINNIDFCLLMVMVFFKFFKT